MSNEENRIILEFPASDVQLELGETITFDNISGFLNSDRVTYNNGSLTEKISAMDSEIDSKADAEATAQALATKADAQATTQALATKADKTFVVGEVARLDGRIDALPEAMIFKGTLGVGGTITELPTASAENEGWTFKCITAGTYEGLTLKVGDTVTCFNPPNTSVYEWDISGHGDTDTDTWRAIKVNGVEKLGNGISSGGVDIVEGDNIKVTFDGNGNKVEIAADTIDDTQALTTKSWSGKKTFDEIVNILPTGNASGSIANFNTSLALPLVSAKFDVNASGGGGTPSTPIPIVGVSEVNVIHRGANVLDLTKIVDNEYYSLNSDGSLKILNSDGRAWTSFEPQLFLKKGDYVILRSNPKGYFTLRTSLDNYSSAFVSTINNTTKTFTLSDDAFIKIKVGAGLTSADYPFNSFDGINYPSTDTTYHAYNGNTTTIQLGQTVYGGYFTQDKDGHRRLVVTHKIKDLGSLSWTRESFNNKIHWYSSLVDNMKQTSFALNANLICSCYSSNTTSAVYGGTESISSYDRRFYIYDTVYDDVTKTSAEFKNYMQGVQVVYELAEPFTVELPDGEPITALVGTNNVYADSGDIEVTYKKSIDDAIAELQALILS